jgi:adenylate cyclase
MAEVAGEVPGRAGSQPPDLVGDRPAEPAPPPGVVQARSAVGGVLVLQILANGLGVGFVALYLRLLVPAGQLARNGDLNLVVFGVYLGAALLIALPANLLLLRRAVVWVREGTPPTARQRWLLFRLPLLETLGSLVGWFVAAVVFGVINVGFRRVGVSIALAGLVTCTLLYLLLEGHFRPLFALALRDADLPPQRRDVLPRLLLAWLLGSGVPLAALGLSPLLGDDAGEVDRLPWLALAAVIGGGAVMAASAVSVSRPIGRVRAALRRVEQGELDVHLPVDDLGELGQLAEGVNDMVAGLREREALRASFVRQVGRTELVDLGAGEHRGERRHVTVLLVDLQGYTRFSEQRSPEEVVAMLNRFFRVVVAAVNREGGWVNKFEGDAALCIFGAPHDTPDHARRALRAAAAIPVDLSREPDVLSAGVGVATGDVLAGFVGTPDRHEYTVIGDVVNLAARLCEMAKDADRGVLVSGVTVREAGVTAEWRRVGTVRIRGRSERAEVYAPIVRRRLRRTRPVQ